ncbi:MAG: hypothetical protein DRO18_03375 [Thermoprotei archaeon]|nr:MAG: hypothetical protein DRO18_03375 [Thermoprotei archaeon]
MSGVEKPKKGKIHDAGQIVGWVEVIVRDKHGNIKYHIGKPAKPKKNHHNSHSAYGLSSSFPAKELDDFYWRKNIITDVGLACIIRLVFAGLTEDKFGYLAIGTGTTAESASDTALESEIARKAATVTQTTTTITDDTALLEATFSSADGLSGSSNVSETGIFNASSGGDMLARKVFSAVPVDWDAGDTLTIRYYVQMTR